MAESLSVDRKIGALINQSGRLRMLSHRAAVFAMRISYCDGGTSDLEALGETVAEFKSVKDHVFGVCAEISRDPDAWPDLMADTSTLKALKLAEKFFEDVCDYSKGVEGSETPSDHVGVNEIVSFVTGSLLDALNAFNAMLCTRYEDHVRMIREHSAEMRTKQIEELQSAIKVVNGRIKMVSINAQIEAKRAGHAGAAFGVVAEEVARLSAASDKILSNAMEHLQDN